MGAVITVKGAWATLAGISVRPLQECLTIKDPKRYYNKAYREKRWDGNVALYEGRRFPAGLVERVVEQINKDGKDVTVVRPEEKEPIDTSRFTPSYLGGIGPDAEDLTDEQCAAIMAMLTKSHGIIKSPTSSGKTELMAVVARYLWEERGWRTLVVVPKKGLAKQTVERFRGYYGSDLDVGQCGDGLKEIGTITVGTAQTLIGYKPRTRKGRMIPADPELYDLVKNVEVLMMDEAHHAPSDTWYAIAMDGNALRRYGLSGTPLKYKDMADLKLIGATGPVLYEVSADILIEAGFSAQPKIAMVCCQSASGPELPDEIGYRVNEKTGRAYQYKKRLPYADAYPQAIIENEYHNRSVLRAVQWLYAQDRKTLVLCRRKEHFLRLADMMRNEFSNFMAVWGDSSMEARDDATYQFTTVDGGSVLLATTIFDEGEDVPGIEAIVMAEGVKVSTNAIQRIGRGMRKKKNVDDVWIVDFVPMSHKKLGDHAVARAKAYEREGYPVRLVEDWPELDEESPEDLLPFLDWE